MKDGNCLGAEIRFERYDLAIEGIFKVDKVIYGSPVSLAGI